MTTQAKGAAQRAARAAGPTTLDHLRSRKAPVEKHVYVPYTDDGIAELEAAREALGRATLLGQTDVAEEARLRADALEERVRANSAHFHFRSIGKAYQRLLDAHPAGKEQLDRNRQMPYDLEKLRPALIAACLVSPVLSADEVRSAITENEAWNDAEIGALFDAAVAVNNNVRTANLGN